MRGRKPINIPINDLKNKSPKELAEEYNCSTAVIYKKRSENNIKRVSKWRKDSQGYIQKKNKGRVIFQHRIKMEEEIGRKLKYEERIHHIDCNKCNNEINNLYLTDVYNSAKIHSLLGVEMNKIIPYLLETKILIFIDGIYYLDEKLFLKRFIR